MFSFWLQPRNILMLHNQKAEGSQICRKISNTRGVLTAVFKQYRLKSPTIASGDPNPLSPSSFSVKQQGKPY